MKPSAVLTKKVFAIITLLFFSTHSAFAALAVSNGDFSDLTGLTNAGGGWYHGTPTAWSLTGSDQYVINYNRVNLEGKGTFSQSLGTVALGGEDITVSFQYGDVFGGGYYASNEDMITAQLWDTTSSTLLATKTVKNTGTYGSLVSETLSNSSPAIVGNTIEVRFISLPGTGVTPGSAAALDNISVSATDSTAPTITNISSSTADGSYNENDIIDIDVTFSEAVTSPSVTVTLNTGGTCNFPVTNSTTGTCNYTV